MKRQRWHLRPALVATAIFAALAVAVFEGVWRCPVALILGVPCPSCGLTRAASALLHGRLGEAVRIHPVAPLMLGVIAGFSARIVWLLARTGETRALTSGVVGTWLARGFVAAIGLEVVVWLVRAAGFLGGPVPV